MSHRHKSRGRRSHKSRSGHKSQKGRSGPRSRSVRFRGGKRTEIELNAPKCAGKRDFLTQDLIDEYFAFRLGKTCFDIRSLREYILDNKSRGLPSTNPFSRDFLTDADYAKINRKLKKLDLGPVHKYETNYMDLFDKAYDVLVEYSHAEERPGWNYDAALREWQGQDMPNPREYMSQFCDPNGLEVQNYYNNITEVNDYIRSNSSSYYSKKDVANCIKDIKKI